MPMSSVRMISETGEEERGLSVCADTNVTRLADSSQLKQVPVRIRGMDGAPVCERYRTCYDAVTCPCRMERQDPQPGSPDQATTRGACGPARFDFFRPVVERFGRERNSAKTRTSSSSRLCTWSLR